MKQDHVHKYETKSHHGITAELTELGLQSAEIRKCADCGKTALFVVTKRGKEYPVIDERSGEDGEILLA